jgi:serine/threonine-protein kinase
MATAPLPAPGDVLDAYRLEAILGEGAMGVVFRAIDGRNGAVVAVKVLRPELGADPVFTRRFEREAAIASALRHPRLVPVLSAGAVDGTRFVVAEYAAERTLAERIATGPLAADELARLAAHIGEALDALTERDLVHRDVTPRNVLVGAAGMRLADFGLARGPAHTVLTGTGRLVGNVSYLAPELVEGQPATAASDLYSLGCVLFEAVAGRPPFGGRLFEIVHGHVERPPPDPLAARDDLPRGVADAILAALAKDPRRRPATGRLLARLVRIGLADVPQGARSVQL